ncbi:peptide-methionine (R)-S-oxide reductase MsrB [Haloplanus litoreus]|uniref:peptide-methionine (R)-S-oxide reductase n=1 Tax=Haloplanus litoreus TaxID=767515 RepID=A0ABD5ZWL8_9EURY
MSENERSLADLSDDEWRERLTDDEYHILRERGTEPKFSGDHLDRKADGTYTCTGCGAALFDADTKFGSGTGWPSFYDAVEGAVTLETDTRHGMTRTEVLCARCGGHLGHVFEDGPDPTGERYCINSVALDFDPED